MEIDPHAEPAVQVGIDALAAGPLPAGVGRYVEVLLLGLERLGLSRGLTLFARRDAQLPASSARRVAPRPWDRWRPLRLAWEQLGLPWQARRLRLELLHGVMHTLPLAGGPPGVVTVHDLTFELFPHWHQRSKVLYFTHMTRLAARRARLVICVSEATRRDLLELHRLDPDRVRVVHNGVHPRFFAPPDHAAERALLEHHGLAPPYLLALGVLEPRKNLERLLRAYSLLASRRRLPPLALVGKRGWGTGPLERLLAELPGLQRGVRRLGYVADEQLPALLRHASGLLYPSLYEGFGLPVAEALACGTPVLCSPRGSLPEVAGDAAVYVDPERPEAIAEGLETLVHDSELVARLRHAGPARASRFGAEAMARATWDCWRLALGRDG